MSDTRLTSETRDLVWFSGSDVVRFLNDLISQEISSMSPGEVARSLLLGARGKLDHLLWVLRGDGRIGLVTDSGRGNELAATLGRYRIRVDVEIGEPEVGWLVVGDGGVEVGHWRAEEGGLIAGLPWKGPALTLVTGQRPSLPEVGAEEMEAIRIRAREPRFGIDVNEETIPQESGLVDETVNFTKGCYLGQELVARIDSRGHVNRHLRLIEFPDGVPVVGLPIESEGDIVGMLTSASGSVALGMVRREIEPGSRVTAGGVAGFVQP